MEQNKTLKNYKEICDFLITKTPIVKMVGVGYENFIYFFEEKNQLVFWKKKQECVYFYKGRHISNLHRTDGPARVFKNKKNNKYFLDAVLISYSKWRKSPEVISSIEKNKLKKKVCKL